MNVKFQSGLRANIEATPVGTDNQGQIIYKILSASLQSLKELNHIPPSKAEQAIKNITGQLYIAAGQTNPSDQEPVDFTHYLPSEV
jgi:hypothetical protein